MTTLPDTRYTIHAEGTGHRRRVWVARFCRRWIGCYLSRADALAACLEYQAERMEPRD